MPDPIKDLYSSLKSTKLFLDENDFRQQLSKNPKEVFDVVSKGKSTSGLFIDYDDFENATGLKKKNSEKVSEDGGKDGTSEVPLVSGKPSKGFEGLKPAKVQPVKVEVPKQLREEEVKIPKQVAGAKVTDEGQSYVSNLVSSLDRGFYKNLIGNPVKGLGTLVEMGTSAMTGGRVKEGPVSDALMRFGNWFNNAIDEVAPQDPEFKNSLSDQFGQALGQVGSLVLTGGVGAGGRGAAIAEQAIPKTATTVAGKIAAKAAPTLRGVKELTKELATPASISAGLTVGQSEFERAKEAGATDEQAFEAFYKNAAVGSVLEKIPVMQFLKRFNNATSGGVANYIKTKGVAGITGGLEEATTEVLQQIYANKTAQDIYNINQNIFEGLTESGGIGFGVGFLLNAMGAQAKTLRRQGKEQEAQTLENQEQEFKAKAEGVPPAPPGAAPVVEESVVDKLEKRYNELVEIVNSQERKVGQPKTKEELEIGNVLQRLDELKAEEEATAEVAPQVPAAPAKAEVVSIDEKETIRQMKPFTDEMANIERKFENRGLKIDTDYDNEIIVTDRQGNILDPEEIPSDIADLAAAYEQATMKLGEFDQVAREKALAESRKVEEVVGEEVAPQVPAAPKVEPVRQLGTGANVYFENDKYRVNDYKDKTLLNVQGTGDAGVIANLEFSTPDEAVSVAKTLNSLYPQGVPEAVLLDKVVEDIKTGKYKEQIVGEEAAPQVPAAPITKEEIKTEEDAIPEPSPEGLLQPQQERIGEEGGERRGVESPVERLAATQKSKTEAAQKEVEKRLKKYAAPEGKQTEVNKLVNEVYKFNNQRRGRLGLKSTEGLKRRNELLIEAKRLGFETRVDSEGRIKVKGAKAIDKSYSNMAIDKNFVPLEQRGQKIKNLFDRINGLADAYGYDFGFFMPNVIVGADGRKMDNRQIKNALQDLNNGIPSKGANAILNSLQEMAESGYIEVRVGQDVTRLPIDEYFNELEKDAKERDIELALSQELDTLPERYLVKWVEEMADEQSFEKEEYEPTTEEAEAEGGKERETAATREQAIREAKRGAVPPLRRGAPTAKRGEEIKEEVVPPVPPTPPKPEEEEEYVPEEKDKSLLNRLYTAKNIPEEARIGFEREGLRYQTKSQKEAELVAKGVIDELGIDEALNLANSFEFDGDVNSLIYAESLNRLAEMEKQAKTKEEKQALAKRFAEVGIQYGEKSQYGGRFNAAINYFYQKSPLGIVIMENIKREEETELDALKQELEGKKAEPSIRTSEAKVQAARQKRAALKEKYKKGKGGGLTLTTGGLTKEGIEYVGELAVTYIQEGVANVEVIIQRIFLDLKDVMGKSIDEETAKQVEGEVRKTFKETKGKSVLNRIRKRLEKLSKKKQDEVVRKSFNQIIESGGLEYDDFRKIIAEVTGYPELTEQEQARFIELVTKTNVVERMAEKAREDRTEQSLRDFRNAEIEAGKAARELNQLIWNKPDIVKRLTSIMQLSTLGIPALINNPIYNIWNQATLRLPVGLFNDLVDRGITLAAQATGTEYQREYNVLGTQKEFFKKLGFGTKESIEQLVTGLNRQDYIQKEVGGQKIQPLQAAKDLWASFTGKKKLTTAQTWDKAIQATAGVPAEAIARTLNIGDKPQRFAAEGAQAAAFAKSFGLKDLDYKLFIEFPREEAYRMYKSQGLSDAEAAKKADYIKDVIIKEGQRATFQQDNLVNTALSAVFNTVFGKGEETGLANLVKATTVSPYIKIPTNAFWSYYNLVNPEIALLQSFAHGGRAFYLNKAGEENKAKLALRESRYWLAHAVTGMAMKAVVIALVKAAVYNAGSDEEESKREREGKAFYEGQGTVNIDKLNAVLSGQDPTKVTTGLLIPNRWFGQWGTVGNAIARKYENMTPEQRKTEADYYDFMLGELSTDVLQELEQGVFANTSSLLSYLNTGNPNRYLVNTLNMFTNIVHPAALAQISRAKIPNYTTQKADTFLKELENSMLARSSFIRELTGKYPPSKISIWGEPIQKQGGTIQKLFNITRVNKDMFARPLYDDAKKYNDINFFPPAVTSSLNGKQLTVDQTRVLQEFVGAARKARIAPYVNDSAKIEGYNVLYSELTDPEDKKKVLNYLYEVGRLDGLSKFYNQYKDLKPKEKPDDFLKELQFDLFKTLQKYKKKE
jgi:hypothetical protein